MLETSRAVATLPLLFGAKGLLIAARKIHGGWGNSNAAITQINYAIRGVQIKAGLC
jgi:hypothetical protein